MGISTAASRQSIENLPARLAQSAEFLSWWNYLGERGRRLVEAALAERGKVPGDQESESFLEELYLEADGQSREDGLFVTLLDFGTAKSRALSALSRALGVMSGDSVEFADRQYGSVSHIVLPLIMEGKFPAAWFGGSTGGSFDESVQTSLFREAREVQGDLELGEFDAAANWPRLDTTRPLYTLPKLVLDDLERVASKAKEELLARSSWQERFEVTRRIRRPLLGMLRPIVGAHLDSLIRHNDPYADHLLVNSLLTWTNAIVRSAGNGDARIFFKELPAFDRRHDFSGGRIDALEVISVNGRMLLSRERRYLSALSRDRFSSTAHLARYLEKLFGGEVLFGLYDWKCGVGDFPKQGDFIRPENCPDNRHVEQMKRYLALDPLDWYLHERKRTGQVWTVEHSHIVEARLVYFLPAFDSFEYPVRCTGEERKKSFQKLFVGPWLPAEKRSQHRIITNSVVGKLVKGLHEPSEKRRTTPVRNLALPFNEEGGVFRELIESHREFVDEYGIVERIVRRGKELNVLRFDRLVGAMRKGTVRYASFDKYEGRVACLNPEHKDEHPDMAVSVKRGTFHCFACGFSGIIAEDSVGEAADAFRSDTGGWSPDDVVVSEECHQLFSKVELMLQMGFAGSPAEAYVAKERGLDPQLVWGHGGGFYTDDLVLALHFDDHYSIDTLTEYGLLRFSSRIKARSPLVRKLLEEGLTLPEIERTKETFSLDGSSKVERCLPYAVLSERVTFPLLLEGRYSNFYGRAIRPCDKRLKHRTLSVNPGGVRMKKGGFNMSTLDKHDDVLVTEAPLDALTLREMGYPNTVAVIGTHNRYVIAEVARKAKHIRLAFNDDQAGWKASIRTLEFLSELKFTGVDGWDEVSDFSHTFFKDVRTATDFNAWWTSGERDKRPASM